LTSNAVAVLVPTPKHLAQLGSGGWPIYKWEGEIPKCPASKRLKPIG